MWIECIKPGLKTIPKNTDRRPLPAAPENKLNNLEN
jgi:hypothetical protein